MDAAGDRSDYDSMTVGSAKIGWRLVGCRAYSKSPGAVVRRLPFFLRERRLLPLIRPPYSRQQMVVHRVLTDYRQDLVLQ